MQVTVQAFAFLKEHLPDGGKVTLDVKPGTTIGDLIALLELPAGQVHLIFHNHRQASAEDEVEAGDRVGLFPPVAGG